MGQTTVNTPTGQVTVNHPDDATDEQILKFAQTQFVASQSSEPAVPKAPQGGSIFDSVGKGLSFGFADELAGLAGAAVGTFDDNFEGTTFGERYRGIRDAARDNEAAYRTRNPGAALAGEMAGGVLTGGVGAAKAGAFQAAKAATTAAGRAKPFVQTGLAQGGLFGLGNSESDSIGGHIRDAGIGAAIGGATAPLAPALMGAANKVSRPVAEWAVKANKSPEFQKAMRFLEDKVGVKLTTGQRLGSRTVKGVETTLEPTLVGGKIEQTRNAAWKKVQGKLMSMAGFDEKDVKRGLIDDEAVDAAKESFSKKYTEMVKGKTVDLETDGFLNQVAAVESKHMQMSGFQQKAQVREIVGDFLDDALEGPISGAKYQSMRSTLARLKKNNQASPELAELYKGLTASLDDAFADQAGVGNAKRLLDRQYARFTDVRDSVKSGGVNVASGYMPFATFLGKVKKAGDREFRDIATAAQMVLGDSVPNSGTASRAMNLQMLSEVGNSMLGGAAIGGAAAGGPLGLGLAAGIPVGLGQALGRGVGGGASRGAAGSLLGLTTAPVTNSLLFPAAQEIAEN